MSVDEETLNYTHNSFVNISEQECSALGRMYYKYGQWHTAADFYNRAIRMNPQVPKYLINLALCLFKLGQYMRVIEESGKVLDIDPNDVRAHFFIGSAYHKLGNLKKSVDHLEKAFNAAKEQERSYGDNIAAHLRLVYREMWRVKEDERLAAEQERIELMMLKEIKRRTISQNDKGPSANQHQTDTEGATNMYTNTRKTILPVEIRKRITRREVPDHLFGRMNYKLLKDPVITPAGNTYERKDIEDHLKTHGPYEPQMPFGDLKISQLIPNLAIKGAIDAFREKNSDWIDEFERFISGSSESFE